MTNDRRILKRPNIIEDSRQGGFAVEPGEREFEALFAHYFNAEATSNNYYGYSDRDLLVMINEEIVKFEESKSERRTDLVRN